MRHAISNSATTLALIATLTLAACAPYTTRTAATTPALAPDAHVSMGMLGGVAMFSYQGVLTQDGAPHTGSMQVTMRLLDINLNPFPNTETSSIVDFDDNGRFNARFELPSDHNVLLDNTTIYMELTETATGEPLGAPTLLDQAPRAYTAVFSSFSETAETAAELADVGIADLTFNLHYTWTPYGGAYRGPRAIRRGNMVFLEGLVKGDNEAGGLILTLPEHLRPSARLIFSTYGSNSVTSANAQYRLDISPDGTLYVVAPTPQTLANTWVNLTGIAYALD